MNEDTTESVARQLGETMVELRYIREQVDRLNSKVDRLQTDLEKVKIEQATVSGGRKAAGVLGSIIGGLVGAAASIITILFFILGGSK